MRPSLSSMRSASGTHSQCGASAVEFAIVAPLLFMLLFGILGFGIVFAQNLALENAARAGARAGVVADATCVDIALAVLGSVNTLALKGDTLAVEGDTLAGQVTDGSNSLCDSFEADTIKPCEGLPDGSSLYVIVTIPAKLLGIIPFANLDETTELRGVGTFECEFT